MLNDLTDKAVLITGGTMGIGLATGLALGRQGAHAFLTHRWGSADEDQVRQAFKDAGAPEPAIVEADVSRDADTRQLMELVGEDHDGLEVFVSNVCVVQVSGGLATLSRRALNKSLEYSAWPLVSYIQEAHEALGSYPRYVVGISSDGPDVYYQGYDYVAVSKAVMEVLGRYLTKHLMGEDVRINMVRTRNVLTESALAVHGQDYPDFIRRFGGESHVVAAEEVADVVLALCSGLLDAMSGQVINVDRGGTFCDNIMRIYHEREEFGL
jgi:NAD(P)-dependent dehydrogenase (short-subunit alcohol dehydrogenase family)